jgi:hypothetical protein
MVAWWTGRSMAATVTAWSVMDFPGTVVSAFGCRDLDHTGPQRPAPTPRKRAAPAHPNSRSGYTLPPPATTGHLGCRCRPSWLSLINQTLCQHEQRRQTRKQFGWGPAARLATFSDSKSLVEASAEGMNLTGGLGDESFVSAGRKLSSGQPERAPFESRSILSVKDGVQIRSVWI